jgi:hypothetical protein
MNTDIHGYTGIETENETADCRQSRIIGHKEAQETQGATEELNRQGAKNSKGGRNRMTEVSHGAAETQRRDRNRRLTPINADFIGDIR